MIRRIAEFGTVKLIYVKDIINVTAINTVFQGIDQTMGEDAGHVIGYWSTPEGALAQNAQVAITNVTTGFQLEVGDLLTDVRLRVITTLGTTTVNCAAYILIKK